MKQPVGVCLHSTTASREEKCQSANSPSRSGARVNGQRRGMQMMLCVGRDTGKKKNEGKGGGEQAEGGGGGRSRTAPKVQRMNHANGRSTEPVPTSCLYERPLTSSMEDMGTRDDRPQAVERQDDVGTAPTDTECYSVVYEVGRVLRGTSRQTSKGEGSSDPAPAQA